MNEAIIYWHYMVVAKDNKVIKKSLNYDSQVSCQIIFQMETNYQAKGLVGSPFIM